MERKVTEVDSILCYITLRMLERYDLDWGGYTRQKTWCVKDLFVQKHGAPAYATYPVYPQKIIFLK